MYIKLFQIIFYLRSNLDIFLFDFIKLISMYEINVYRLSQGISIIRCHDNKQNLFDYVIRGTLDRIFIRIYLEIDPKNVNLSSKLLKRVDINKLSL